MLIALRSCFLIRFDLSGDSERDVAVQIHDQGLVNSDPRFIYVPFHGINLIPTDIRGLTYNRCACIHLSEHANESNRMF